MNFTYDPEADAIYVYLSEKDVAKSRSVRKNQSDAAVDYAADGEVVGVEFLAARRGIDVTGVPRADEIADLLCRHGFVLMAKAGKSRS